MPIHVAILQKPYLDAVLAGRKTMESRLTRNAQPPYGEVQCGERLYLKQSGGPFMATAIAGRVHSYDGLTPARVDELRKRFNDAVGGDARYWQYKRDAQYATFIELHDVLPVDVGPRFQKSPYKAWFVLPDDADPVLDVTLTDGALRNGYVSVAGRADFFGDRANEIELTLPDGERVRTDLYRGQRIRWRGWRAWFQAWGARAGDVVRFVATGRGRYRVVFIPRRR